MRLFIFGAGYSGRAIARAALSQGAYVTGTTRSEDKAEALGREGTTPLIFAGGMTPAIEQALRETTHLVVSIAPEHGAQGGHLDPVLAAARDAILSATPALRWIGYLSTVGVYGDHDGAWVDEDAPCRPVSQRSRLRLEAETAWRELGDTRGVPVAILRLSGIYGPGRNALRNLAEGTARRIVKPGQVFNRIHVEDIAGASMLLAQTETGGIFNVTDDEPSPPQDVVAHAAGLMGRAAPPEILFDQAEMTPMARSFYGENKRVSNARIKAAGYAFRFPDYRTALDELWRSGRWRG